MPSKNGLLVGRLFHDLSSGLVVFLVALPLCLGVALASNPTSENAGSVPMIAGVLAGVVGGILVGLLSGSHTSVSGPAAGLTAVVAAQIAILGSFQALLLAVVVAGVIQVALGLARAGFVAAFFPSSVIKGLLAAIGVILILKQIPHIFGHDADPEGEMSFFQPDHENTFSDILQTLGDLHLGATAIGLVSILVLMAWGRWKVLKHSPVPAPLIVVVLGMAIGRLLQWLGGEWILDKDHLVNVPVAETAAGFLKFLSLPDFSQWSNPAVYSAAATIAAVASLESLLNLEAIDKLDPKQRHSPPNRELLAQGIGNVASGLVGGLPVTSVIVRSSVNINAGGKTKLSAIIHGVFLLVSVVFLPTWLNSIPLSCLAAILLVTGIKLASPALVKQMWAAGRYQFVPFAVTVIAIVLTDLLVGTLIGLAVSIGFILNSNMRRPVRRFVEKHLGGNVTRIELANQVSFLNRAALSKVLDDVPSGGHMLLDAQGTDYIDPDVLDLIRDYKEKTGPARNVEVSLLGFRAKYQLQDQIQYVDYSTRDLQSAINAEQVLQILKDGHERFRTGRRLTRDITRQVSGTADGQHPLAVVLSCIDSRTPAELVFDLGVGDIFSVRVAGNVLSANVLGSVEYACAVAGAKLVLVMGHTRCGAVTAAVDLNGESGPFAEATGCQNLDDIILEIQRSTIAGTTVPYRKLSQSDKRSYVDAVARCNIFRVVAQMRELSGTLNELVLDNRIQIVGAMYDVVTGEIEFLPDVDNTFTRNPG